MRERELDSEWAVKVRELAGKPKQREERPTFGLALDLQMMPAHGSGVGQRLECLVGRFFGCDPRGDVHGRAMGSLDIGSLPCGKKPRHDPCPVASHHALHPGDVHQINPDADQLHRAQIASAIPRSGPGTGR